MTFTANFYVRMLGAFALAYAGYTFGRANSAVPPTESQVWATNLLALCGLAIGLILTPYLTIYPLRRVVRAIKTMPLLELVGVALGMLAGLFVGVLVTVPLSNLPGALGEYGPLAAALLLAYIGSTIASTRKNDILAFVQSERRWRWAAADVQRTVVDTSVIIDGRIGDVIKAGFISGTLLVPRFVLQELQQLADSGDPLTRAKGKRGLDALHALQEDKEVTVEIVDADTSGIKEVDEKLVAVAKREDVSLLTNDANLDRVAHLQGVPVQNLNRLADALRVPFAVGDGLRVHVRSEGREREQGVGFTEDGTMIVVEDARSLVGQDVHAIVTRIYTTQTGRIIFAQLDRAGGRLRA